MGSRFPSRQSINLGNAVMLGSGYFNPLTGFMNKTDSLLVAEKLKTTKGLFWPVPIVNMVKDTSAIKGAKRIALRDPNVQGNPVLAIMDVEAIEEFFDAQTVFDTEVPKDALLIEIFRADNTAYSKKQNKVIMMRDGKDHTKEDWVTLSGTKVREMLSKGAQCPLFFPASCECTTWEQHRRHPESPPHPQLR